jgi:5'-nucleotidase
VNPGLNYGHLVLHSGTVGAALTARTLGCSAVAVSLAWGEEQHWVTAATLAADALDWLGSRSGAPVVVNLNVPNVALEQLPGVRGAPLNPFNERWRASTSPGELLLEYDGHAGELEADADFAVVKSGYAAVTLLQGVAATALHAGSPAAQALTRALDARIARRRVA